MVVADSVIASRRRLGTSPGEDEAVAGQPGIVRVALAETVNAGQRAFGVGPRNALPTAVEGAR